MPRRGIRHSRVERPSPALRTGVGSSGVAQAASKEGKQGHLLAQWMLGFRANFLGAGGGLGRGGHDWHLVRGSQAGWTSLCRGQQALSLLQEAVWSGLLLQEDSSCRKTPHALPAGCHCCSFPIFLCCSNKHHVYLWSVPACLHLSFVPDGGCFCSFSILMRRSYIGPHFFCIHFRISLSFMMKKFSIGNVYISMILETPDNSDFISVYWHLPSCVQVKLFKLLQQDHVSFAGFIDSLISQSFKGYD